VQDQGDARGNRVSSSVRSKGRIRLIALTQRLRRRERRRWQAREGPSSSRSWSRLLARWRTKGSAARTIEVRVWSISNHQATTQQPAMLADDRSRKIAFVSDGVGTSLHTINAVSAIGLVSDSPGYLSCSYLYSLSHQSFFTSLSPRASYTQS
jgi:hypothetical protein